MPKLKTAKTSLNRVLIDDDSSKSPILFDAVNRVHQIIIHVYLFIRLYVLNKYHTNQKIPFISKDFIATVIKVLIKPNVGGPKPKGHNLDMFNEFIIFYEADYENLGYTDKIDGSNLSKIM